MSHSKKRTDSKTLNALSVINLVKMKPNISRSDIAKYTGLNKSTIGKLVQTLIDEHWLEECPAPIQLDGAGRRPIGLLLNNNVLALLGAEIGCDYITVLLTSITGNILFSTTKPFQHGEIEKSLEQLADLLQQAWSVVNQEKRQVLGLGVALPGLINKENERAVLLPNISWENVSVAERLRKVFHKKGMPSTPISIINDANAAGLAKFTFGSTQECREPLVYLTISVGIGAGIVGKSGLYCGYDGWAGEVGHSILQPIDGNLCLCGQTGCAETLISQRAFSNSIANDTNQLLSIDELQEKLKSGDKKTQEEIAKIGWFLGILLRNIANTFNPKTIIIGGSMSQLGFDLLEPSLKSFYARTGGNHIHTNIQLCSDWQTIPSLGSAAMILEQNIALLTPFYENLQKQLN